MNQGIKSKGAWKSKVSGTFKKNLKVIIMPRTKKACMPEAELKAVENEIRDLINWIEVWNEEEKEGGTKKIENEEAEKIKDKLRAIAEKLGIATL